MRQTFTYADAFGVVDLGDVSAWQQGAVQLQQLWAASATATTANPAASRPPTPVGTTCQQDATPFPAP